MTKLEIVSAINTLNGLLGNIHLTGEDREKIRAKIMEFVAQL